MPYLLSSVLSFSLDCSKYRRKGKKVRNGTVWKAHWDFLPNFLSLQYYSTHKCVLGTQRCTFLFYYSINHFKFSQKKWQFFTFEHGCNFCSENSVEKRKELSFTWQKPLKRILVNLPVWNVRALVARLSGGHLDIKSC